MECQRRCVEVCLSFRLSLKGLPSPSIDPHLLPQPEKDKESGRVQRRRLPVLNTYLYLMDDALERTHTRTWAKRVPAGRLLD